MGRYWNQTDLIRHIEAHNRHVVSQFTVPVLIGTQSANFEIPLWVPPTQGYRFERVYLVCSVAHTPSASAYWSLSVNQIVGGRYETLSTLGTDTRGIGALETTLFSAADAGLDLGPEEPLVIRGTKTGSPAALTNCLIQLVLSVA